MPQDLKQQGREQHHLLQHHRGACWKSLSCLVASLGPPPCSRRKYAAPCAPWAGATLAWRWKETETTTMEHDITRADGYTVCQGDNRTRHLSRGSAQSRRSCMDRRIISPAKGLGAEVAENVLIVPCCHDYDST